MESRCIVEKTLKIPLAELKTVGLVCNRADCGGVAEMPTDRLDGLTGGVMCPSCGHPLTPKSIGSLGGSKALGLVLKSLAGESGFSVEFVLPVVGGGVTTCAFSANLVCSSHPARNPKWWLTTTAPRVNRANRA